jgi:hypothetical protein
LNEIISNQQDNNYINISISKDLKVFITNNIRLFGNGHNYLIFKLLYSGNPSKGDLLNFLFYISIIDKKRQEIFTDDPDKFGNTFLFPITPNL